MNRKGEKGTNREQIRMCRDVGARAGLTMVVIALALCVFAQPALAAQISVVPECQIVSKDESFTVNITVYPEESEVYAASYTLYFNNTLLNATSQVNGTFLSQDGASTLVMWNVIDNTSGKTEYGETRRLPATTGVTENGTLATITFEAIADGFCELRLSDLDGVILSTSEPESIPTNVTNGSVRIGICGDVTGDGNVRVGDGRRILKWIGEPDQYPIDNLWAADVTGDGNIRVGDGRRILKWIGEPAQYPLNCCCE